MNDLETQLCNDWRTLNFYLSLLKTRHTQYQQLAVKKIFDIAHVIREMGNDPFYDQPMADLINGVDYYSNEYPGADFRFLSDLVFAKFWQRALEMQRKTEARDQLLRTKLVLQSMSNRRAGFIRVYQ